MFVALKNEMPSFFGADFLPFRLLFCKEVLPDGLTTAFWRHSDTDKMHTCVRFVGHRCAFSSPVGGCFPDLRWEYVHLVCLYVWICVFVLIETILFEIKQMEICEIWLYLLILQPIFLEFV